MLVNFFLSETLVANADMSFSYRYSSCYQEGVERRVGKRIASFPLPLLDCDVLLARLALPLLRRIVRVLTYLLLLRFWLLLWNTFVLWRLFGKVAPVDVLHINNGGYPGARSCMAAAFAAKLRGIRAIVYVVNNIAVDYKHPDRWSDFWVDRLLVWCVDCFVTGSSLAGRRLTEVLHLSPLQLARIHNGIALRPVTESKEQIVTRLSLPYGRLLIGVVALLEERKGHIYLLRAMKLLKQRSKHVPFLLIEGHGSEQQKLLDYVNDSGLGEDVLFVGDEHSIFSFMNAVDVIVLPSIRDEDFPNVVIEAMGLGKAVVASSISGVPEQIDDMDNGVLVAPKNVGALVDAMVLLQDVSLRQALGANAKEKFMRDFTAEASVVAYLEKYKEILARCS